MCSKLCTLQNVSICTYIVSPPVKLELWIKKEVLAAKIEFQIMRALTGVQVHNTLFIEVENFEHVAKLSACRQNIRYDHHFQKSLYVACRSRTVCAEANCEKG